MKQNENTIEQEYAKLKAEYDNLKADRDEQAKWAYTYRNKYEETLIKLIHAENKNDKISKFRFFLALPFALIGYPFKFFATGWFKIANKIYGYDDFE